MRYRILPSLTVVLAGCSAAHPVIFSDPNFNPATVKHLVLAIEDHSGLGDLAKNPALMRATSSSVVSALVAKGYDVNIDGAPDANRYLLLAQIESVQRSKRYIPFPITIRKLPVSCDIMTGDSRRQLSHAAVDGYRPYGAKKAGSWINDPAKLYSIAIQDACEQALVGATK